ncbi:MULTISPECIES: class I SAM-dependent methyltransferase [unclassified Paenibacillus]|uniref:class I SAM-dependent methyltransferase n=1 Tax=unclassified Paenibacillus TaxID=185978 RepID=UPI00240756D7|nr:MULTISPECIES: class I SAM-dependent methyltransferase [unclassified Paenibacillus]MDF9839019.1 methyltransferase (TIGR00027 family) [Paenibacillus sp. PastF-2]MDF9845601.1 methyltransferase (TIGR00027 family) [Paenibacillus sp. PastM-2]MDF9852172.1 methyltransferase (TIGR00027 family) [Paenibacillus sp. PastF-1]MDH6478098.1 methyltransferase (TIGR00027 family) [Paenibacillus sp. PastH-2]MDH6505832.1 methyltransferase (TIGR00027 family) [Paenibacillus sp. PastM-3]
MKNRSLTALVSAFARAYHAEHNQYPVFKDSLARAILTDEEYSNIGVQMSQGIGFFLPEFKGSQEEALRAVVDFQLSPTPLGRAAFTEQALHNAVMLGAGQYLILAAGYDTFAYRQPEWAGHLQIYEIDHPATAEDKRLRTAVLFPGQPANVHEVPADLTEAGWEKLLLAAPEFDPSRISFSSLLGISYYLTKTEFKQLLSVLADMLPAGSSFAFDYPDGFTFTSEAGERTQKQVMMAAQSGEPMQASYTYPELEQLLEDCGLLIYRHLIPPEITRELFQAYNDKQPEHPLSAFDNVNYCLAVKR